MILTFFWKNLNCVFLLWHKEMARMLVLQLRVYQMVVLGSFSTRGLLFLMLVWNYSQPVLTHLEEIAVLQLTTLFRFSFPFSDSVICIETLLLLSFLLFTAFNDVSSKVW